MGLVSPRVQALTASLTVSVQNSLRINFFYDLRERKKEERKLKLLLEALFEYFGSTKFYRNLIFTKLFLVNCVSFSIRLSF